ncbi:hypothetical protein V6N11_034097 [Hibiscus sabdariffa]|uniref:Uncharacterized protein n=1 Tax=Hibiscus sabdariffa TaxID=183260 RepID=A0ABR2S2B9_9ROSI
MMIANTTTTTDVEPRQERSFPSNLARLRKVGGLTKAKITIEGPLRDWTLSDTIPPQISNFSGLLNANGQWNIDRLSAVLLPAAIPHIMGILPPQTDATCDIISWSKSSSGVFALASAYRGLVGVA